MHGRRPGPPADSGASVAESLMDLVHAFSRVKARFLAEAHDVEWSSQVILRHLAASGPLRAAALAESLQLDPSTVSRQVATLVRQGMIERQADPEDGRASLLVLTPRGCDVVSQHDRRRHAYLTDMLDEWSAADLDRFATLFRRFVDDFDRATARWLSAGDHLPATEPRQKDTA